MNAMPLLQNENSRIARVREDLISQGLNIWNRERARLKHRRANRAELALRAALPWVVHVHDPYSPRNHTGLPIVGEYATLDDIADAYGISFACGRQGGTEVYPDTAFLDAVAWPKTAAEVRDIVGCHLTCARARLDGLYAAGLVHREEAPQLRDGPSGRAPWVYVRLP